MPNPIRPLGMLLAVSVVAASAAAQPPGAGVPETLARDRAATLANVQYDLEFNVPGERSAPVRGRATVRFTLARGRDVAFDFAQPRDRVHAVRVGAASVAFTHENGHILVPASATRAGENVVSIDFTAGDEALNRNDEFLYTLFVPARARLAFPSFDQPDIKAKYRLALEVPEGWQAVANGAEQARSPVNNGRVRVEFVETAPLPTYLFSFVAGRFEIETAERAGRQIRMFHRETDPARVKRNREAIFDLHGTALEWLERYTAIPYAFGKFDIVLIPSFQFSGMEHAGAILYSATGLLLEESATQNQQLDRASVIAHETAHMWFGDLVTMRWFNDVWMKEVFANFMAAKIVNPSFPRVNHELRFLLTHYPSAYQVDRTSGTNPIRQPLANLDEAGQLYGPIIYQKAPIVMRQLEMMLGEDGLRDGLREYLKRYAFGNATWLDLVRLLDARTPRDLASWSRAWVEERGRPAFEMRVEVDAKGNLKDVSLRASDPLGRGLNWPQRLRVLVGGEGGAREYAVDVTGRTTRVPVPAGAARPRYILPNGAGLGYGLFVLDDATREYLLSNVERLPDALSRGSAWVTLWDNLLEGRVPVERFLDSVMRALPLEEDEQNAERLLAYLTRASWRFLPSAERMARSDAIERLLRDGIARVPTTSQKAAWFNAFRDTALSPAAVQWLERLWRREERITGLPLAEPDELTLALEIAVRGVQGWQEILQAQHDRTQNPDRKARFAFVMPALSADPAERERAFDRLRQVENRRREPWVLESLRYLNHPLRADHARQFVRPALELLREIQQTGDIFFPSRWMDATLFGHRSREVNDTVRAFIDANPRYPERLRWTILVAADELDRAARLFTP